MPRSIVGAVAVLAASAGLARAFPAPKPPKTPPMPDITGEWQLTEINGRPTPAAKTGRTTYYDFDKDGSVKTRIVRPGGAAGPVAVKAGIAWKATPAKGGVHEIDWTIGTRLQKGIFRVTKEGELEILLATGVDAERPTSFEVEPPAGEVPGPGGGFVAVGFRHLKMIRADSSK